MRKLKLQIQTSLDGFVAGPNGEGDWVFLAGRDDAGFLKLVELAESCDTLLLGRKMSPGFIEYWAGMADSQPESPMKRMGQALTGMRKIVFSRTQKEIAGSNVAMENGDLATVVQALKNEPGKDILVYGGANFASSLISQDLVDEYIIIVNPVSLGKGLSIFSEQKVLKLVSSAPFNNGKVMNKYVVG